MTSIVTTFLRGLGVVAPLAFTIWLVWWLAQGSEALLREVFLFLLPARFYHPGLGLVLGLCFVFGVGVLLKLFLVERFWQWLERRVERIPFVKTIYNSTRDFLGFFSSNMASRASTVVRVDVAPEVSLVGFITTEASKAHADLGDDHVAVFLPMSFQMGGFTVLVPRSRLTVLDWSLEEAMRFVVTAGIQRKTELEHPSAADPEHP